MTDTRATAPDAEEVKRLADEYEEAGRDVRSAYHHNTGIVSAESKRKRWRAELHAAIDSLASRSVPQQAEQPGVREAHWWALVMGAAASLEDAANCLRDPDAKRAAEGAARHYREKAKALAAQPVPQGEPAGWKLVPIKPTQKMIDAAFDANDVVDAPGDAWGAMVAAAPPAPQQAVMNCREAAPEPAAELGSCIKAEWCSCSPDAQASCRHWRPANRLASQPLRQEGAEPAMRELAAEAQARGEYAVPLKRGSTGVCSRSKCICERDGLGNECIWLRPAQGAEPAAQPASVNQQLVEALKDKQRLDWLDKNYSKVSHGTGYLGAPNGWAYVGAHGGLVMAQSLRDAIDAALAAADGAGA